MPQMFLRRNKKTILVTKSYAIHFISLYNMGNEDDFSSKHTTSLQRRCNVVTLQQRSCDVVCFAGLNTQRRSNVVVTS